MDTKSCSSRGVRAGAATGGGHGASKTNTGAADLLRSITEAVQQLVQKLGKSPGGSGAAQAAAATQGGGASMASSPAKPAATASTQAQAGHDAMQAGGEHGMMKPADAPVSEWTTSSLLAATKSSTQHLRTLDDALAAGYTTRDYSFRNGQLNTGPDNPDGDVLHVDRNDLKSDGKVLDPNAPEVLLYKQLGGDGAWTLVGAMYVSEPGKPTPTIADNAMGFFHSHDGADAATEQGGTNGMMHAWFTPDESQAFSMDQPDVVGPA